MFGRHFFFSVIQENNLYLGMALSIDYLYRFALKLIRKNQSGSINGTEFSFYWNDQQSAYMADLLGRFQKNSNGKEGANTGLIQNSTILTKLTPFTKPSTLTIASGVADKPTDYVYGLSLIISDELVYKINHDQVPSVVNSVIDPPSVSSGKFYCTEYEDYYSFLPTTVTTATLSYIRNPTNVVWGFTYGADGQQEYNAGTSVQPEWDDISNMEITKRVLKDMGVSLKDNDFINFGNSTIQTGD